MVAISSINLAQVNYTKLLKMLLPVEEDTKLYIFIKELNFYKEIDGIPTKPFNQDDAEIGLRSTFLIEGDISEHLC